MTRPGYVYLLRHPSAGVYRIGRSTCSAERARLLGRVAGGLCEIVHLIGTNDAPRLEAALHRAYRPVLAVGDWVRLPADAVEAIRGMTVVVYGTPDPVRHCEIVLPYDSRAGPGIPDAARTE